MKMILLCTTCLLLISCSKQSSDLSEVGAFIETLKKNQTERIEAPDFSADHISELLTYRNEQVRISNFPRNPLSSFVMEEVTIGMYVLWTVESIRMEEIDHPDFYLFASLNPRVATVSGEIVDQDDIFPEIAAAYQAWWTSGLSLDEKLQEDPLQALDLRWN